MMYEIITNYGIHLYAIVAIIIIPIDFNALRLQFFRIFFGNKTWISLPQSTDDKNKYQIHNVIPWKNQFDSQALSI